MNKQNFKSIYFLDEDLFGARGRSVTIAFSKTESSLKEYLEELSNEDIRNIIKISNYQDLVKTAEIENRSIGQLIKTRLKNTIYKINRSDVTFQNSKHLPFQRWFSYAEGFSPEFVTNLINKYCPATKSVFDPFSGTGTTYFASDSKGLDCYYSEVNPLMVFISETKIDTLLLTENERQHLQSDLQAIKNTIIDEIRKCPEDERLKNNYHSIFNESVYYDKNTYSTILRLRTFIDNLAEKDILLSRVVSVAVISILLKVSHLKKVGDVRFKTSSEMKKESFDIRDTLVQKLEDMILDISDMSFKLLKRPTFLLYNSGYLGALNGLNFDCVITSPPYLNGTNYLRNTKIELWFMRYLQYKDDLRGLRNNIITSGINDVKSGSGDIYRLSKDIPSELLKRTLKTLERKAYDSRIPIMINSYFVEMKNVFEGLYKHVSNDGHIFIDIGDSIFSNVHINTGEILKEVLVSIGYNHSEDVLLRDRRSHNGALLSQKLLIFRKPSKTPKPHIYNNTINLHFVHSWKSFKNSLPHQNMPFIKKNWGNPNHSLCSYGGKLKPAIAHHLINTFVPPNGRIFDPFSGVGTIPFEASLSGRTSFGMDISLPAYYISSAKVSRITTDICYQYLNSIRSFIHNSRLSNHEISLAQAFGFNKKLPDYFEKRTLNEILLARKYISINPPKSAEEMMVVSSFLHVLHGNRPYALSRRSHPITPYAPTGDYEYKNVCEHIKSKLEKSTCTEMPPDFVPGQIFLHDSTDLWPQAISDLDAIITSPPFFDSTRFYLANWMRLWLCGWDLEDFKQKPHLFVEERQKISFSIYDNIFRQSRERLKPGGILVFHLGKSTKCDMAKEIVAASKYYFKKYDLFDESVKHCQSHGIRDKGTVTSHQYLVLY